MSGVTVATPRAAWSTIAEVDPDLWTAMLGERDRQRWNIELIASENYAFARVLEAQGSWLTNKYAEGLPGKRYYGGCEFVDVVERLAIERALTSFRVPSMSTSSLTPGRRPTWPPTCPCSNRSTASWA